MGVTGGKKNGRDTRTDIATQRKLKIHFRTKGLEVDVSTSHKVLNAVGERPPLLLLLHLGPNIIL